MAALNERQAAAQVEDSELVARLRRGETAVFVQLMRRTRPRVGRIVQSVLHDKVEAEDVMQDAYTNAFTHLETLRTSLSFSTWIGRIAFHEALSRVRHTRSSPFSDIDPAVVDGASPGASPEAAAGAAELEVALERAVDTLPDDSREIIALHAVEGRSIGEAAELLGLQRETVRSRLFRARARLREMLAGWVEGPPSGLTA